MLNRLAAIAAACLLACAPALAQDVRTLPLASPLTGAEKMPSVQGTGCVSKTTPCTAVAVTPSLISTFLAPTYQARDADLDAIAALTTVDFGRQLLTKADAGSVRSAIGVTATGQDTAYLWRANNLSGLTDVAAARANLGYVPWTLCKSGAAFSVTGTTAETTAATCTLPAASVGPNGFIEIIPLFTFTASTNGKTLRVRLGGAEMVSITFAAATQVGYRMSVTINNVNSASSQIAMGAANGNILTSAPLVRTSVNTASAQPLTITCQLAVSTETCALESYLVRVTYGA